MDEKAKQRILNDLTDFDEKDVLAILESIRLIREETGWGSTLVTLSKREINEIQTVITRRGADLRN